MHVSNTSWGRETLVTAGYQQVKKVGVIKGRLFNYAKGP